MAVSQCTPTPSPRPPAAVALVRASTDKQDASTADQREQIARWAATSGHTLTATFEDDGISGSRLDRPGLLALLAYVEKNPKGGVVVAWRRNRLARPDDPRDGLALERRIEKAGWRLHYLHGAQATGNALVDTLTATIEHHEAGSFLRTIALDTMRGTARAVLEKHCWRGPTPYGYARSVVWPGGMTQVIPRASTLSTRGASIHLVPGDPAEVEAVRYAFERYATGTIGVSALCVELMAKGVPIPRGDVWKASGLQEILRSPVYAGHVAWNRRSGGGKFAKLVGGQAVRAGEVVCRRTSPDEWIVARDAHEPLVPVELWEQVQVVMRSRALEQGGRRRAVPFPLSGLVRCAACGGPFCVSTTTRGGRQYRRYLCSGQDPTRPCRSNAIALEVLEGAVLSRIAETLRPLRASTRLREAVLAELTADTAGSRPDLGSLDRQLVEIETKTKRAVANMGEVTPDVARLIGGQIAQWRARSDELRALRETAAAQAKAEDPGARVDRALALLDQLERLTPDASPADRRQFYEGVIEKVVLAYETRMVGRRLRHLPTGGTLTLRGPLGDLAARLANGGGSAARDTASSRGRSRPASACAARPWPAPGEPRAARRRGRRARQVLPGSGHGACLSVSPRGVDGQLLPVRARTGGQLLPTDLWRPFAGAGRRRSRPRARRRGGEGARGPPRSAS